jgi:exopolysaccharide production protein ExoZ
MSWLNRSIVDLATRLGPIEIVERGNVALARHGAFFALGIWIWISTTRRLLGWEIAASVLAISACISEIYLRGLEFLPAQGWLTSPVIVWLIGLAAIYWFSRNDAPKYFRSFGLMTYPLYLVHHVVGLAILQTLVSGLNKWVALFLSVLCVIAISWIVSAFLEPRIVRLMRR